MQSIIKHFKSSGHDTTELLETINVYKCPNYILYESFCRLDSGENIDSIVSDIKAGDFGFNTENFNVFKEKQELTDTLLTKPLEIREGENECRKCKQKKTLIVETQTRSADEGFTYYIYCFNPACKAITKS